MKKMLLCLLTAVACWGYAVAQDQTITGTVKSDDGAVLPGVSILVKGTTKGTSTDPDGNFTIAAPVGSRIIFSFVGFVSQEYVVDKPGTTPVIITLISDTKQLSEVVVTGTGAATDKKRLGIAVESITAKDLPAAPSASVDQALVGKIAGAQISSISGNPGDPVNIVLRGINTVQGGTKPLIMVDGVQVAATDINSLDLTNVDRIEVVQGAASASLYGAQGANGVIQVFTKKGKQGKVAINFSTSYSENQFLNVGNVHKADLHPYLTDANNNIVDSKGNILNYNNVGAITGISYQYGGATRYAIQDIRNVNDKPYNANLKYYDHFKQVFQTGTTSNNSLSISGANEKSDFAISLANNHTVSPVMKNGYVDRSNLTANIGTELFKGFKIRSITQLVYTKNTLHPGLGGAGGGDYGRGNSLGNVSRVYGFLNTSPFFDLTYKLADGTSPYYQRADFVSVNAGNPFYQQEYSDGLDNKIDVLQNFNINYSINKFVELDAKYGINYRTENARWTYYNQTANVNSQFYKSSGYIGYYGSWSPDYSGEIDNWQYTNTFQNFLANAFFKTDLKEDFGFKFPISLNTQVGFDYRKRDYREYSTYGLGLSLAPPINLKATGSQYVVSDYKEPFITYGFLVNQKVDFGDYGGITAGFRSDYSSAFGGGSTPFTFPHADVHILISSFWKDNKLADILPYLKIRAASGKAGIQPGAFDRYPVLDQQNLGPALTYSVQPTSRNPNLNVEVSKETEIGTDFTIAATGGAWFKSINGSLSYWKRSSENVIYNVSVAPSIGSTGQLTNAIDMSSKGVQFSLNIPVFSSSSFKWDFTTNWGHQLSTIDKISGNSDIILTTNAGSTGLVLTAGQPIGQVYGYKALTSLDYRRQNGDRYIDPADESKYTIVDGRVVKKSDYQMQFTDETYPLMNPNPKFNASFINNLTFKDFLSFSVQFDWINGSKLYNQTKEWMYRDGISGDFTKPVTIDGENGPVTGAFPAYWSSAYYNLWGSTRGAGNNATKDFFVEDASFLRLRNISLALDFAKLFKIKYTNRLQLVLTGRNILTVTKYTGYDPEVSSGSVNSSFDRGIDHSTLPNIKSYQIGLNIGF
jgi:TonB-linked SusC/RagA family outer membrane protein